MAAAKGVFVIVELPLLGYATLPFVSDRCELGLGFLGKLESDLDPILDLLESGRFQDGDEEMVRKPAGIHGDLSGIAPGIVPDHDDARAFVGLGFASLKLRLD